MQQKATLLLFIFANIATSGVANSQHSSGKTEEVYQALFDSVNVYQLTAPRKSLHFAKTLLDIMPFEGHDSMFIEVLIHASSGEKMLDNKTAALQYIDRAIDLASAASIQDYLMRACFQKASIFDQYDEYDSSLGYYHRVLELYKPEMDMYFLSSAHSNLGNIYASIGDFEKAEKYLLQGYHESKSDEYAQIFSLAKLVNFYDSRHDPRYVAYLDTFSMTNFYQHASEESIMAHFIVFLNLEESSDAQKEAKMREVFNYSKQQSAQANQIGFGLQLYMILKDQKKYNDAHKLLTEIIQIARESKSGKLLSSSIYALYQNHKDRGNMNEALKALEWYSEVKDSFLTQETRAAMSEASIKFEVAQKDNEIERQRLRMEQDRKNRNFLITITILLGSLAVLTYIYFRNRAVAAQLLALQEKEQLVREKELAQLSSALEAQEMERHRIARDLHDGVGSLMSGISAHVELLDSSEQYDHIKELRDMVKETSAELRRTSYELMPVGLLRMGFEPAVRDLCVNLLVKNGIVTKLEIEADLTTVTADQQLTLYRIVQELFQNIVKHAHASEVLIQFLRYDDEITIVVEDNGAGFAMNGQPTGGIGLGSIRSRVDLLKGELDIASSPGKGTTVTINFKIVPSLVSVS